MNNKPWYLRLGVVLLMLAIFGAGLAIPEIRGIALLADIVMFLKYGES